MAKVKWAEGIEYVSGLLTKRPKAGSMHSDHCSALLKPCMYPSLHGRTVQAFDPAVVQ